MAIGTAALGLITGGLSAGASALGSLFSSGQNKKNVKRTIQAQKEMQEYEWQQNLALYNYNNAYNTPSAQMERLQEAGLNPNLVYGNGSVSGNTSGQLPRYDASQPDYRGQQSQSGEFLGALSTYLDYATKTAQIDNLKATNEMIQEQTAGVEIENARRSFDLGLEEELRDSSVLSRWSNAYKSQAEYGTAQNRMQISAVEERIAKETYPQAIEMVQERLNLLRKQGRNIDQDSLIKIQQELAMRLQNEYRELGVTDGDNIAFRVLARVLQSLFPNLKF